MSDETEIEIEIEAKARHERHINHPSHRPLSPGYELVGLRTEERFAKEFGKKVDLRPRPGGDKGFDFWVMTDQGFFLVDVKGARKAYNLAVEVGKVNPDAIYVLARYYDETDSAELLGWEWGKQLLRKGKIGTLGKFNVLNHLLPRHRLRPIEELKDRCI